MYKRQIQEVYISSPFGMVSSFLYGTIQSALFTLLAVYAAGMNFSIFHISLVTFLLAISGAISQWPIGKLSDIYDRRKVIIFVSFAAAFFALCAIFSSAQMYLPEGLGTSKFWFYFFLMIRRPPRSTPKPSSAASDVYKRQCRLYSSIKK